MGSCRHTDIQEFDGFRCCLSCGEVVANETREFKTVSNHSNPSPYQYKRLSYGSSNEIRLVRLYPGQNSDNICCDLVHVNLVDEPAYEAVSYTWATATGDASLSQVIYCGGQTIAVTKNCEAALRSLRSRARNRLLWMDAICINQADTMERNFQVSLMAMIYSNASQVLVYLCSEDGSTFRATNRIMEYLKGTSLGPSHYISMEEAFSSFISHPYFHRVWILQEISLARLVVLITGDHTIHWTADTVQRLLALCHSMDIDIPSVLHYMPGIRPEEEDLLDVLYRGRNSFATDSRDKVFALLGLVPPHIFAALPVDYNLATEELFTKVALHLIREHKSLNVLKHASSQPLTRAKKAPSWVPDWRVKDTTYLLPPQFEPSQISDIASSPHIPDLHVFRPISRTLPCSTKGTATIDHAKVYSSPDISTLKSYTGNYLQQYHDPLDHNSIPFPCLRVRACKLDTIVTQFQRTGDLYTTQVTDLRDSQTTWERLDHNTVLISFDQSRHCSSCTVSEPNNSLCADRSLAEQQGREFERKRLNIQGKTIVFLTVQSIGFVRERSALWAGKSFRKGDTIWALPGVDVPFILRAEDDHYVLIGECFLYKAMLNHLCSRCGRDAEPWAMDSETIDIW